MDLKRKKEASLKATDTLKHNVTRLKQVVSALFSAHSISINIPFDELTKPDIQEAFSLVDSIKNSSCSSDKIPISFDANDLVEFCVIVNAKKELLKDSLLKQKLSLLILSLASTFLSLFPDCFHMKIDTLSALAATLSSEFKSASLEWKTEFLSLSRHLLSTSNDSCIKIFGKDLLDVLMNVISAQEPSIEMKIKAIEIAEIYSSFGEKITALPRLIITINLEADKFDKGFYMASCNFLTCSTLTCSPELSCLTLKLLQIGLNSRDNFVRKHSEKLLMSIEGLIHPKVLIPKFEIARQMSHCAIEEVAEEYNSNLHSFRILSAEKEKYHVDVNVEYSIKEETKKRKIELAAASKELTHEEEEVIHFDQENVDIIDAGPDEEE